MVLRRPNIVAVTEEGGRAFPERTIGERTILGASGFSVLRGASETMVSDHGLGRGQTMG